MCAQTKCALFAKVRMIAMGEDKIREIIGLMDLLVEDTSIPKNIRKAVSEARDHLKTEGDLTTRSSSAVYSLEAVSEDINMPMHARTQIWTILSALESVKGN